MWAWATQHPFLFTVIVFFLIAGPVSAIESWADAFGRRKKD